jgi:hypothetical protein
MNTQEQIDLEKSKVKLNDIHTFRWLERLETRVNSIESLKADIEKQKNISSGWARMAGQSDGLLAEAIDLLTEASTADFNSNLGARIKSFLTKTRTQNGR